VKLQLDNNCIEKIEGIDHLIHLEWLGNVIFPSNLADLSFNSISSIEGLENLTKLSDLSLYNNSISVVEGLDNCLKLQVLSLGENNIANLEHVSVTSPHRLRSKLQLLYLRKFKELSVVNLIGNPVCSEFDYKLFLVGRLKKLVYLDRKLIEERTNEEAKSKYADHIKEHQEMEKENDKREMLVKVNEDRRSKLKTVGLGDLDDFFHEMVMEDPDFQKLLQLSALNETIGE